MPVQATDWLHISGQRFLLRRMEDALLGRDRRWAGRGRASSALALGFALAFVALVGCALLGVVRPQPDLGTSQIVMEKTSGALYVRVGDTWHPVLNLASARLIAASAADPRPVRGSELVHVKRGPLLGIPGAPQTLAEPLPVTAAVWTTCDSAAETSVLVGRAAGLPAERLAPDRALLVTSGSNSPAYLLYRGHRAVVDLADPSVRHALRLSNRTPQLVSRALLNAVPEAPPIAAPRIDGAGERAGSWLPGFTVGSVLRITRLTGGDEYWVVLSNGVQRIGEVAADLLRFRDSQGAPGVVAVAPDALRDAPIVSTLAVSGLPDQAPTPSEALPATMVCAAWVPDQSSHAEVAFLAGPSLPGDQQAVTLAQADGRGPAVDAVYLPPGRSAYVEARSLTGGQSHSSVRRETRYLVTDIGVRFAIGDDDSAHDLGLPSTAAPAPWPVLAGLPCGPELSRENASVARDTVVAVP